MDRILVILEVSRKQDYIFGSKKLRDNAARSGEIAYVTSSEFFQDIAGDLYDERDNMVYAGGGHTILEFPSQEHAVAFSKRVTEVALRRYRGMEIFVKTLAYDEALSPGENLKALSAALEKKKALRSASFRWTNFGVEALDGDSHSPQALHATENATSADLLGPPEGWRFPVDFSKLTENAGDNFIAVVHIDGNAMGKRVDGLYTEKATDWSACRDSLQRFSSGIQKDFEASFLETVEEVIRYDDALKGYDLPIRPVILAGDDVCFVTAGSIGLECARIFLDKLTAKVNQEDGKPYAACAGVALVHTKFPFHQAYDLAEELCSSAKRFGSELDQDGRVSAMDWHIEFGQLKDGLSELRQDYETEDGNRLELRPVVVTAPSDIDLEKTYGVRTYEFFRAMCLSMKGEYGKVARSKIKELRTAFKQGVVESKFFMNDKQVNDLLYHGFSARYRTGDERKMQYQEILKSGIKELKKDAFMETGEQKRCLFFDAIEMIDHCSFFEEVES